MVCLGNPSITEVVTIGGFVGPTPVGAANSKIFKPWCGIKRSRRYLPDNCKGSEDFAKKSFLLEQERFRFNLHPFRLKVKHKRKFCHFA